MTCLLPAWFAFLAGAAGDPRPHATRAAASHLDGEHLTIVWTEDAVDEDLARAYLDAMEAAWTALIDEQGWPAPVSSDTRRITVELTSALSLTGLTVENDDDTYPDGVPYIYVNWSYYDEYPDFSLGVAVHELAHASQYAVREWSALAGEAWFWEASAEWMQELGAPERDSYAYSSVYYAEQAQLAMDSTVGAHQYGMFVLPAWLDEVAGGDGTLRDLWRGQGGEGWEAEIAAAAGTDLGSALVEVGATYAAGGFVDSALFAGVDLQEDWDAVPAGFVVPDLERYGTWFARLRGGAPDGIDLSGPAVARYVQSGAVSLEPPPDGRVTIAITRIGDGDIVIGRPAPADTGDEGSDTGAATPGGCACGTGASGGGPLAVALGALAALSSRRSSRAAPRPRSSAPPGRTPGAAAASHARG